MDRRFEINDDGMCVIPDGVTEIGWGAFKGCTSLESIDIPNSVTEIGGRAFQGCTSLESIVIPNSVTKISWNAFLGCTSLESIQVDKSNPHYDSRNNCNAIIETSTNRIVRGCAKTTIPNSVTVIGSIAFSGCTSLESIDIPNSVTEIGEEAFEGCTSLESIVIPNSVTEIGGWAFYGCTSLESIDIPNSVTEIGEVAFYGCTSLKSIHSAIEKVDGVVIEGDAFNGIDKNECTLYIPAGTRWAYRHHKVFGLFKNIEIESK